MLNTIFSKTTAARFVMVLLLLAFAGAGAYWWKLSQPLPIPDHLQDLGGDFVLQSADGPLALQDFRGKVVLLYFGYMNCPDICPLTLSNWTDAFKQLAKTELDKVRGLFISVDPGRDTLRALNEYTNFFHENILGATGSHSELSKITLLYRSDYTLVDDGDQNHYTVEHMSFVYVIDPTGRVRDLLVHDSLPEDIIKSVRNALKVKSQKVSSGSL